MSKVTPLRMSLMMRLAYRIYGTDSTWTNDKAEFCLSSVIMYSIVYFLFFSPTT